MFCYVMLRAYGIPFKIFVRKNDFRWDDNMKMNACDRKTYYDEVVVWNLSCVIILAYSVYNEKTTMSSSSIFFFFLFG